MTAMILDSSRDRSFQLFNFQHAFQPIYNLQDDYVFGYESLIRHPEIPNPEVLFSLAMQQNQLFDLDFHSIANSIHTFEQQSRYLNPPRLSVNVFPSTLLDPDFLRQLNRLMNKVALAPESIIFELNEAESVMSLGKLTDVIHCLRSLGFRFALDDLGKGQSSLRIALELEPDIVKLDRYFSMDLGRSIKKQTFLNWISSYFINEGVSVTLEGIETAEELTIARQAGIQFGQGYFLGRPEHYLLHT